MYILNYAHYTPTIVEKLLPIHMVALNECIIEFIINTDDNTLIWFPDINWIPLEIDTNQYGMLTESKS